MTHLKRPWCWEGLKVGGEGDDRGWDGWMASATQWTWVWVHSGSWWWTGRPGVLQSMGSQRVGHDWATELNWTRLQWPVTMNIIFFFLLILLGLAVWFCWNGQSWADLGWTHSHISSQLVGQMEFGWLKMSAIAMAGLCSLHFLTLQQDCACSPGQDGVLREKPCVRVLEAWPRSVLLSDLLHAINQSERVRRSVLL